MTKLDPADDLVVCEEHCIKKSREGLCPACETGVEVRHGEVFDGELTDEEFRNRVEHETMVKLIRIMRSHLEDKEEGPMWIAVKGWPKDEQLPAGYTEPERHQNVLAYEWGMRQKFIVTEHNAQQTIETLQEEGYEAE